MLQYKLMRCWCNLDNEWTETVLLSPSSSSSFLPRVRRRSAFCLDCLLFSQMFLSCISSCQLLITRLKDPHWFLYSAFIYLVNCMGWLFWGWKDTVDHVLIFTCTHGCWILAKTGRSTATLVWYWVFYRMSFHT